MAIRSDLRRELLKLPAEERQELADELYESLDNDTAGSEWEVAWSDEVSRRAQEIVDGKVSLIDSVDFHANLRAELLTRRP